MIVRPLYNKVRALKRELDKANEKLAAKDKELKKARAECERFQHNIESVNIAGGRDKPGRAVNVAGGRDKPGRVGLLVATPQKNPASLMRDSGVSPSDHRDIFKKLTAFQVLSSQVQSAKKEVRRELLATTPANTGNCTAVIAKEVKASRKNIFKKRKPRIRRKRLYLG